jgi:hypothetical protein
MAPPHTMSLTPQQALTRLRAYYRDSHRADPATPADLLHWAQHPEHWAELQIRHAGWSFHAAEAVVRSCRSLRGRAIRALNNTPPGTDPFDPLYPVEP